MSLLRRRWLRVLGILCISVVSLLLALILILQIPSVATWTARHLATLAPLSAGYRLEVGRASGDWLTGLRLRDVRLLQGERTLADIDQLRVGYDLRRLLGSKTLIRSLTVNGARVIVRRQGESWNIAQAFGGGADTTGAGGVFAVRHLGLDDVELTAELGRNSVVRVRDLTLRAEDVVLGEQLLLRVETLHATIIPPGEPSIPLELTASGAVTRHVINLDTFRLRSARSTIAGQLVLPRNFNAPRQTDKFELSLRATPLALGDVSTFVPAIVPAGDLRLELKASSEGRFATATLAARFNEAVLRLEGATLLGGDAPPLYRVSGEMRALDPADVLQNVPEGSLTGEIDAELQSGRLAAADGSADLRLTDSRLAGTEIESLHLAATVTDGRAEVDLRGNVAGARVNVDGWVRPFASIPSYRLAGTVRRIPGADAVARLLDGAAGDPELSIGFRIAGEGVARDRANLSGRVRLAAVRRSGEQVVLGHSTIRLDQGRLRARPELLVAGGRITGLLSATLGDTISYEVRHGTIDEVDLGWLLEDTLVAPVSGRFSLHGRRRSPKEAVTTARLQLDALSYGERRLDDVVARVRLHDGRVALDLSGAVQGGTLALDATARPFASPVRFTIDSVALTRVDLAGFLGRPDWSGPVTLRGTGSGRWGSGRRLVRGRVTVEPSRLGEVEVAGGTANAELNGQLLRYEAAVHTNGGSLTLAGQARVGDSIPRVRVQRGSLDSFDLGMLLGRPNLHTAINARFTASLAATSLDSMQGRLDLELLSSRVNQAELGPGTIDMALAGGEIEGTIRVQGQDAHLDAALSGNLTGDVRRLNAEGTLRLERLARLTGDSTLNGRVEGKFRLNAAADSAGLLGVGGTVTAVGGVGSVRLQSLYAVFEPATGALVVDTLMVRSNVAVVDGSGRLSLRNTATADTLWLTGRTGDVTPLVELVGIDSLSLDSARIALTVTGPPQRRHIGSDLHAHRLLYSSTLVEQLDANAAATIDSTGLGPVSGTIRVHGLATGGVTVQEAQFAGRYDSLISLQGAANLVDDVRLSLALVGEAKGDTTTMSLERLELFEGGRTWQLARPAGIALRPGAVEVNDFALHTPGRKIELQGVLALRDTSDLTLSIEGLELGALEDAGLVPVPGTLDGSLHLSGPARSPVIDGRIGLTIHEGKPEDLGRIESTLAWSRRGLRLDAVATPDLGGRLRISGVLPWGLTLAADDTAAAIAVVRQPGDSLNLAVQADSFALALFRPFLPEQTIRELRGQLAVDFRIQGTAEEPVAEGEIRLDRVGFDLPSLDVSYRRGRLRGWLKGDVLRIDTLVLHSGPDEELALQGQIRLQPLTNPAFDLTAELRDFMISSSATLEAEASGQLRLTGTLATPVLTGTLRMGETEFFAARASGLAVEEVELTPEDRMELARHFGPSVLDDAARVEFLDRFRLDLELRLVDQVWFRRLENPELNIELTGRLRLRQQPGGELRFFGRVEPVPVRSTLDIYGRTFALTGGQITLRGPSNEARIDVTATYPVSTQGGPESNVVVHVAASGQPDSINLAFSSEPEMPREDMISYIITGRPASDNPLIAGSGGTAPAEALVLGQLTEVISTTVGQELGFEVFQIRQEGTRGLVLTAGRYLTPHFFVSLQQPLELGGEVEERPGTSLGPGFELQYRLRPWLRATLQGGSLPAAVLLRVRHAY